MIKQRQTLSRMLRGDCGRDVYDVLLPSGVSARVILPDGTEAAADMVKVVVNPGGSIRTSYPFSSAASTIHSEPSCLPPGGVSSDECDSSHD